MTHVEILDAAHERAGGYKVDVSRGERIGRVSSEWFSRPADERYLSLSDLFAAVRGRTERSRSRTVESAAIRVEAIRFDPVEIARAGAFVSIDGSGHLRVERGYVRPEDEMPVEQEPEAEAERDPQPAIAARGETDVETVQGDAMNAPEPEEDEGLKPIPDRLMTELTAHRTLALRCALSEQPDVAFLAALHALCLKAFYRYAARFLSRTRSEERRLRRPGAGTE